MKLTIAEMFLLLSLDRQRHRFIYGALYHASPALAGAVLMELEIKGRIEFRRSSVVSLNSSPVGDPVLDQTLALISASRRARSINYWIKRLARFGKLIHSHAMRNLCDLDLARETQRRLFWVFPVRSYSLINVGLQQELHQRVTTALADGTPLKMRDKCATILLSAIGVLPRLAPKEIRKQSRKAAQEQCLADPVGRAVRSVTRQNITVFPAAQ